jgi:ATP-dependent DNA helicase DinG
MTKNINIMHSIFKRNGILSRFVANYQPRRAQFDMANLVLESLSSERHALIEAGTGTGKSFGYALPAAYWALKEEKRVIISTNTITLQQQLLEKELPMIKQVISELSEDWAESFSFELAKGRGNYICRRRLKELADDRLAGEQKDGPVISRLAKQVGQLEKGDRDEIPFPLPPGLFSLIQGDADDCMGKQSPFHKECFIQNARRKLQNAQIIVVNHALFFTDLLLRKQGVSILPHYDAVIMDEAHRVEDQVTNQYTYHISLEEVNKLFLRVTKRRAHWVRELDDNDLLMHVEGVRARLLTRMAEIFAPLAKALAERPQNEYLLKKPIVGEYSFQAIFADFKNLIRDKRKQVELEKGENETVMGMDRYLSQVEQLEGMLKHILLFENPEEWATWVSYQAEEQKDLAMLQDDYMWGSRLHLFSAPIEISSLLRGDLFEDKTVIMTSATLTTQGDFSFVANRVGMDDYGSMQAPSPFNYEEQAVLVVPENVPAPTEAAFESFLCAAMKEIVEATRGRTFLLFTSYSQMNRIYEDMKPWLSRLGLTGLLHGPGVSRDQMLQMFRTSENTILFGCDSFWEGVDVPGDDLICVVMAKLPFPVPTDPLTRARTERLERRGQNSFMEYTLPFSILRLKQGFGRLIRTKKDRGTVVILDTRIHTKRYGQRVLDSLPPARLSTSLDEIGQFLSRA